MSTPLATAAQEEGALQAGGSKRRAKSAKRKPQTTQRDIYKDVTDKIIVVLNERSAPWGLPEDGPTRRRYSRIDILLLLVVAIEHARAR